VPGYEPFLLCDFHVHTRWSDGKLCVAEVIDLYGSTGKFDVIAITDHILTKNDLLAKAGRLATLGRRAFGVREQDFDAYLANVREEGQRALTQYGMLVVPGAEITQNRLRGRKNSHIIALDIQRYVSADQSADDILRDIRRRGRSASPATRTTAPPGASRSAPATCGISGRNCRILSTCGRPPLATICSR
jgi:predicted metal-dependent phosphoesterase TrpH